MRKDKILYFEYFYYTLGFMMIMCVVLGIALCSEGFLKLLSLYLFLVEVWVIVFRGSLFIILPANIS